jgi:magnesium transporter
MLSINVPRGTVLERITLANDGEVPEGTVWLDLYSPTMAEVRLVERTLGVAVPTREEMQEIEVTSRLYVEQGARYMTATLMCQSDTDTPKTTPVTFILSGHRLITVRYDYDEPRPFMIVGHKLARVCPAGTSGESVLMELLDAVIDGAAGILERIGTEVDQVSREFFESEESATERSKSYRAILRTIGRKGDLTSKVRESLVSIGRLLLYLANEADSMRWAKEPRAQLRGMQRDVQSQSDHAAYLSQKINALLGVVSLEQNNAALSRLGLKPADQASGVVDPSLIGVPAQVQWYVSYAWNDDRSPEGRTRENVVDKICATAEARGLKILRDKNELGLGESISNFMRRIGVGDRIFVILSDEYLRSPYCMFELSEIWRTSKQEGNTFLERVRVYALPDARVWQPGDWVDWAIFWKQEHDALENRARQHGASILGEHGHRKLMQMQRFYTQVADILGTLADIVQPRTFEELERYGLADPPRA